MPESGGKDLMLRRAVYVVMVLMGMLKVPVSVVVFRNYLDMPETVTPVGAPAAAAPVAIIKPSNV